jgi:hypothetical protein
MAGLSVPIKKSLSAFPSMDPSPEPMGDLAISIASEDPVTEPCNVARTLHSSRIPHEWAIQCRWNFSSSSILMKGNLYPISIICRTVITVLG